MSFELSEPFFLTAGILLGWIYWSYRRSLADFSRRQRRLSLTVRSLILVLLILALAGLEISRRTREKWVVFLIDESRSVDEAASAKAEEFVRAATAGRSRSLCLRFGDGILTGDAKDKRRDATDIASALEGAAGRIPSSYVPSIVLLSDGNETRGDALKAVEGLGASISTVPLPAPSPPETQLADVLLPPNVRRGEPFNVEVVVRSNRKSEGTITLYRGDYRAVEKKKPLEIGENRFVFRQTVEGKRQEIFTASVTSDEDTRLDDNTASNVVFVGGAPRILLIDEEERSLREFAAAVHSQGIDVEIRPAKGLPEALGALEPFDAVGLSNVPATSLSTRQMETLRVYVRDLGGGLLVFGGDQAFGLGGYDKTPLGEILPLRGDFEKEKEKPSLALCLAIDRSGSMTGEKIEMAKEAAESAVELLGPRDFAAVVAFDHRAEAIVPMGRTSEKGPIKSRIGTMTAGGGTNLAPALRESAEQLEGVSAALKHLILLTDGYSEPGDFEGAARRMASAGITLSTVGIGDAQQELLERLASVGGGRHYVCQDAKSIPQIFIRETMIASKSAIREEPFSARQTAANDALTGIDIDGAPPLLGFVMTRVKPGARLILSAEGGEPLLAEWRRGLGRTLAFTSDVKNRWGTEWLGWPEFPALWAQLIRRTLRSTEGRSGAAEWSEQNGKTTVTLDAVDENGAFLNSTDSTPIDGRLTVIGPGGSKEEVPLEQIAPGRFSASAETSTRGEYSIRATLRSGEKEILSASRGKITGYPEEWRVGEPNLALLEQLAKKTGGEYRPAPESVFDEDKSRTAIRVTPLWPFLLAAAAILYVLDVLLRRVDFAGKKRKEEETSR